MVYLSVRIQNQPVVTLSESIKTEDIQRKHLVFMCLFVSHPARWSLTNPHFVQRLPSGHQVVTESLDLGMPLMSSRTRVATFARLLGIATSHFVKMKTCPVFGIRSDRDIKVISIWKRNPDIPRKPREAPVVFLFGKMKKTDER